MMLLHETLWYDWIVCDEKGMQCGSIREDAPEEAKKAFEEFITTRAVKREEYEKRGEWLPSNLRLIRIEKFAINEKLKREGKEELFFNF